MAVFASALLTSVAIALFETVHASKTLTATELWRTGLSVSAIPPTLICLLMAFRMRQSLEQLRVTHHELVNLACFDGVNAREKQSQFWRPRDGPEELTR